ncbi:MAG: PDZ domain-containing protein [Planctomycetota bacterium]
MRLLIATWVAVLWTGASLAAGTVRPTPVDRGALVLDEDVARLVAQMGGDSYRTREAASKRLESMGLSAMPYLLRYRNHRDPEIAIRIEELLKGLEWATRGAIIVRVDPGSRAEKLGLRPGDVVLKVNEEDVRGYRHLGSLSREAGRRLHLWRDGQMATVTVPAAGKIGFRHSDWDLTKGGLEQARGMSAWARGRYDRAFRQLAAAREAGMTDLHSTLRLIAAAEYRLDHTWAMEVYDQMAKGLDGKHLGWSYIDIDAEVGGLPFTSAHTAALLRELPRLDRADPSMAAAMAGYFGRWGRNFPLAKSLADRVWPAEAPAAYAFRHWYARGRVRLHQRRYARVVSDFAEVKARPAWPGRDALMAAVCAGKTREAANLAVVLAEESGAGRIWDYTASHAVVALSAAVAAGDEPAVRTIMAALRRLPPEKAAELFLEDVRYQFSHMALNRRVCRFLDELIEVLPESDLPKILYVYFDTLRFTPDLTVESWRRAWRRWGTKADFGMMEYTHWINAECLLRLGRYDQAEEEVKKFFPTYSGVTAVHRALKFLRANRRRLEGDWVRLNGVTQVYDGRERGSFWAVRYDGRTFYIDPAGRIREIPGLAPGEVHRSICGDSILSYDTGTMYVRRSQIYLLDEKAGRWVPTFASPNRVPGYEHKLNDVTGPVVLRYILEHYPVSGPGREMMRRINLHGDWRAYEFNGDLTIAVHPETLKLIDLSREIGRLAGRKRPAAIYWLQHKDHPGATMIPTDCGLWRMDAEGGLSRWAMPLKDPNVMVSILTWPKRKGKYYVGVAPQQGGRVFELDIPTGRMSPTKGFNGLGPDDSFHWFMNGRRKKRFIPCEYAIQRLYRDRTDKAENRSRTAP